jgi:uncharacterized membrane-anchored protein
MTGTLRAAVLAVAAGLVCAAAAVAQPAASPPPTDAQKAEVARLKRILDSEHPQFGDVRLPGPQATLRLGQRFYFLGAEEAKQVLKEWGNPPEQSEGVLGIVFPAGKTFAENTWGAVVSYEPSGYVSDKDADKADYDKMVRDEQASETDENERLKKQGFATAHLVGWAQPPTYDHGKHFLIWARDIKFSNEDADTLNYDLRILGRHGVLSVNLVSTMPKLAEVRADAAELAGAAGFDSGAAYGDFQAGKDKTAEYGVAGLVAAGLGVAAAQKLGLFALIAVFAKKAIVLIVAGFAAIAAWVRRLFGRGKAQPTAAGAVEPAEGAPKDAT